jgi:nucleoside-diphosphate-sugar epimerase
MRIAVLGARGTVGGVLYNSLKEKYNVTGITRDDFDATSVDSVRDYFSKHAFDIVFNAAINPNSRLDAPISVAQDNFNMFTNLYDIRHMFGRVIHFASGAEFDMSTAIEHAREEDIFKVMPSDPYGMSKNVTSRIAYSTDDWYLLRIFGTFHPTEKARRLLPRLKTNHSLILEDKYFDYMYLEDLLPVAEAYINETPVYKDMNLVYPEKMLLSELVDRFCNIHNIPKDKITNNGLSNLNYTGNSDKWDSLNLPRIGINAGLERYK